MSENEYLPYKAINIYIERNYLEQIIGSVLTEKGKLSKEDQIELTKLLRQYVKVLGFRNPIRAPLPLQINAFASAFEEKDEVIPFALSTYTKINLKFAKKVKDWLKKEGWQNLALERVFTESEGFISQWPEDLTFDDLDKKFKQDHPDLNYQRDDLILMVLWITGQLPPEKSDI